MFQTSTGSRGRDPRRWCSDVPADLLGRFGVELGIEGERYVDDAAA